MVLIESSDRTIWNLENTLLELINYAEQFNKLDISLQTEGPCCETLGLNRLIDTVVKKTKIKKDSVVIYTSNQISSSNYKQKRQGFCELGLIQNTEFVHTKSTLEYRFGLFVGRSNWLRLGLASYLNLCNSNIRYHFDFDDYHMANFGLEELIQRHPDDIDNVVRLVKKLPIRDNKMNYPICWDGEALDLSDEYNKIFCDVVTETFYSGRVFFLTEKLMRTIANRRPFLLQSSKWALRNLKLLGFKTFDQWWDEGYDEDPWDFKYQALKHNIDYINNASQETIEKWYDEMQPVLEHNYQTLMNLSTEDITETEFYYE